MLHFVGQAVSGHMEMAAAARPIPEVIADPSTPPRTRKLLGSVEDVRRFARANGLRVSGNYEYYVELDRKYPIWFVNASHPLRFQPRTFRFPIIGSFPGLSWFSEKDAKDFASELERQGWDVNVRGVSAFSTGGWFDDPIVWSMLTNRSTAVVRLVNVVLHESVHATVLIKNQQYFNESLASFVANTMTGQYLQRRTGEEMPAALLASLKGRARGRAYAKIYNQAYQALDEVYKSSLPVEEKLERKAAIIVRLRERLHLKGTVNNATLIGFRLYQVAKDDFSALYEACGYSWRRFLTAVSTIPEETFGQEQRADFGPVVDAITRRGCPSELFPIDPLDSNVHWWRSKQRRRLAKIWGRTP